MFLKKSKYKNGRTFLSIVEAYRDENGKPKQRLIQKISYLPFKYIYNELNNYEIRKIYRVLSKIEDTFKVSKTNFGARPTYVWTKEHIEGHFFTCFIALVIMRLLERKRGYKYTADQIVTSAKKYNCINIDRNIYQFIYKDRIIGDISKAFNINLDKKYEKREKIKKLLKY